MGKSPNSGTAGMPPPPPSPACGGGSGRGWSSLPFGHPHDQSVDLRGHLDLAGEPRARLHVIAEIEHVLLHGRGLAHDCAPALIHIDMTGRAGAGAAAFSLD